MGYGDVAHVAECRELEIQQGATTANAGIECCRYLQHVRLKETKRHLKIIEYRLSMCINFLHHLFLLLF